jgi:diguanylate cyclase (GGDEF)-like protein
MTSTKVAWLTPEQGTIPDGLAGQLRDLGFTLQACAAGELGKLDAQLIVLPWSAIGPGGPRHDALALEGLHMLLLARDDHEEAAALELAGPGDGVARVADSAQVLAGRLRLLARTSSELKSLRRSFGGDPLTGLTNRRRFSDLATEYLQTLEPGTHAALVFIDLDQFKRINDRHGHAVGDEVLRQVARRLSARLGPRDVAARFGGEEFAVLVERPARWDVLDAAGKLQRETFEAPFEAAPGQPPIELTASAGLAFLERGMSLEDAIQECDRAAYDAKARGRNRLVVHDALEEQAVAEDSDVQLLHFQNVAKIVNERTTNLVTLFGKRLVESARRDSLQDKLTQVWNRRYFDRRLPREMDLCRKDGRLLTLAMLDIDHFGNFNRTYGLPVGDAVLRIVASVLCGSIRPVDWVARYGGEEFALVVPGNLEEAAVVAERVRAAIEASSLAEYTRDAARLTVSIGLCQFSTEFASVDELVQLASIRLREAKTAGRNRICASTT